MSVNKAGLYIHIPFCASKCLYCDFYSGGARIADWEAFTDALCRELDLRIAELRGVDIQTIYIGGGTPSLMPADYFGRLMTHIAKYAPAPEEVTIEVNPDDVSPEKIDVWKSYGVNRVSMGVQSFDDGELKRVGRRHNAAEALSAYHLLRSKFSNISLDVIYDMPGQTDDTWHTTIKQLIDLSPEHISAYNMMYEEGTALTLLRKQGVISSADEETIIAWYETLTDSLSKAGYEHYETSNFAKPGYKSRHNSAYWIHTPYIGLGPSAHSFDGINIRRANPADIKGYLQFYCTELPASNSSQKRVDDHRIVAHQFYTEEILSEEELFEEMVMLRLRTSDGISIQMVKETFGNNRVTRLINNAEVLLQSSLLSLDKDRLKITEQGIMLADSIILKLLE